MSNLAKSVSNFFTDQKRVAYLFIIPQILIQVTFVVIPMFVAFAFSTMDFNIMWTKINFVGLDNYIKAISDPRISNAFLNTTIYTVCVVSFNVVVSLLIAVMIKEKLKINVIFRSVFFLPVICSMTVVGLVWKFLLDPNIGSISSMLLRFGVTMGFFKDPNQSLMTVVVVMVWKGFGYAMVIFLASLQSIPEVYYEAAAIDGVTNWQKLIYITIPSIRPTLGFVVITGIIGSFQVFDSVYMMTNGGPLFRTETVVFYIYNRAFIDLKMGYASAIAIMLFAVILIFSLFTFRKTSNVDT